MTTGKHSSQTVSDGIHIAHAYEYADAAARIGASGFVAGDIGKLAKQTDTLTWWILVATTPTWKEITPGAAVETTTTLTESPSGVFTYTSEDSTETEIDISDFETGSELNIRDSLNRMRSFHSGTQLASTISNFDIEVSNNTDVASAIKDNVAGEINSITEKVTPVSADLILIEDSADSNNKKKIQIGNLPSSGGGGTDADAIHDNVAGEISAITEKAAPVSADLLVIEDSADSNNKKRVQIGNLPGGSSDPSSWMDRAAYTDNSQYVNTTDDFTTEASAVPIDVTHTPNASGVYLITINYTYSVDTGTYDHLSELVCDNGSSGTASTVRDFIRVEPADAAGTDGGSSGTDQRIPAVLRYLHTTTASTTFNVIFRHKATDPGIESAVKSSVLTIERWS